MEIRPATTQDIPQLLPMVARICAFHETIDPAKFGFRENPAEMYRGWLGARVTDHRSVILVADAGNPDEGARLVGFLIATVEREVPVYRLKEFGFIHDLWTEELYRHEGLARQMVTLAVEKFREMGVQQVRLDTAAANDAARHLFVACGFRPSAMEMLLEV